MKRVILFITLLLSIDCAAVVAQSKDSVAHDLPLPHLDDSAKTGADNMDIANDTLLVQDSPIVNCQKKRPWRAAAEVVGFNGGLLLFDRYVLKGPYAYVTLNTIKRNFEFRHWFWDSDRIYTNLVEHPYHGSLFYNAARSNGMNQLESSAYTIGGDLLWELAGENELPSVNDLISTAIGGIAIGEVTHRLSQKVYNPRLRGAKRVANELFGALINPFGAFNRVLTGEAWRVGQPCQDKDNTLLYSSLSAGMRWVSVNDSVGTKFSAPYIGLQLQYGDPFDYHQKPFDYFSAELKLTLKKGQQIFKRIQIMGQWVGINLADRQNWQAKIGVFQHFLYAHTNPIGKGKAAYQIAETASAGPGFICKATDIAHVFDLEQALYFNGMLLGGMYSDYKNNPANLDYNLGSGFTAKSRTAISIAHKALLQIDADFYRMFTWLDYNHKDAIKIDGVMSAQGEANCTSLWTISPKIECRLNRNIGLTGYGTWVWRHTNYKYRADATSEALEWGIGLTYDL